MSRQLAFSLSSMTAMLVALLCALMPAGQHSGRAAGSAFDPTTSTVALHSKPQPVRKGDQHVAPDPGKGDAGNYIPDDDVTMLPTPESMALTAPILRSLPLHHVASAIGLAQRLPAAFQARAPPII